MGLLIMAKNSPDCRETVIQDVNGYILPDKSIDSLENARRILMNDSKLLYVLEKESIRTSRIKYDVHNVKTLNFR